MSESSPPDSCARSRTKNAQAQADLRARRKQYTKTLEDTVTSLESCVRQLRHHNAQLVERLERVERRGDKREEEEEEDDLGALVDRLTVENSNLHQMLADAGLAAAAASKMARVGRTKQVEKEAETVLGEAVKRAWPHGRTEEVVVDRPDSSPAVSVSSAAAKEGTTTTPPGPTHRSKRSRAQEPEASETTVVSPSDKEVVEGEGGRTTSVPDAKPTSPARTQDAPASWSFNDLVEDGGSKKSKRSKRGSFEFDTDLSFLQPCNLGSTTTTTTSLAPTTDSFGMDGTRRERKRRTLSIEASLRSGNPGAASTPELVEWKVERLHLFVFLFIFLFVLLLLLLPSTTDLDGGGGDVKRLW
ncbi:hypothetical protein IE53DRAFT_363374 [Violaceomyces palustris]|uniref:Uncharacterized protein n=1 Tax=Violaceomyces palustris TaxID=1673888 RepID=A0ACD0NTR7_9BASI|nr:hypothetical protein IE53DRAFT_363374 [Violaceomyces palustris]